MHGSLLLAAAICFGVLALMFVPLERAWKARSQPILRREFNLDILFFIGQYLIWNAVALYALIHVHRAWMQVAPFSLGHLPTVVQMIVALVGGELATYWLHRAFHRFNFLWKIHEVHHSSEQLDWLAAHREHPLDGLLIQMSMNVPAMLMGLSFSAFGPLILFRGLWAIVVHSNVRLPLGPFVWILGGPQLHRYHHAADARDVKNFANLSPWIDALFGTHAAPSHENYRLGNEILPLESSTQRRSSLISYLRKLIFLR
jgi:sterol desaturase/sphingolipid hydroxylase (fatty acid hydroxylase superfamily)